MFASEHCRLTERKCDLFGVSFLFDLECDGHRPGLDAVHIFWASVVHDERKWSDADVVVGNALRKPYLSHFLSGRRLRLCWRRRCCIWTCGEFTIWTATRDGRSVRTYARFLCTRNGTTPLDAHFCKYINSSHKNDRDDNGDDQYFFHAAIIAPHP